MCVVCVRILGLHTRIYIYILCILCVLYIYIYIYIYIYCARVHVCVHMYWGYVLTFGDFAKLIYQIVSIAIILNVRSV